MKRATKDTARGILRYLKPHAAYLVLSAVFALVAVAGQLVVPFLAGRGVDCIVSAGNVDYARLSRVFLGIGLCVAAATASQWFMNLCNNRVVYHVLADVRRDAFRKIEKLPLKTLDARAYGEVASVVVTDADQFAEGLLLAFTQFFTGLLTIFGVLGIMLALRWEIALIVVVLTPASLLTARFIASRTYRMFREQAVARADQTAFIDEMIGNLKTVKAYGHEDENVFVFREKNETLRKSSLRAVFYSSTTNPTTRFINSVVYAAVALAGSLFAIGSGGAFSVGSLTTFLSYSNQYTRPFNEISEVVAEFQNALACAARLFALIAEEEERSDEGLASLGEVDGRVEFCDVDFSYTPERPLIEHMNFTAEAGKRIAIVGPTGCGKTTLINLIMRFYDVVGGSVKVDGMDVREITRVSLRKNVGMVLQDTWIKEGTVRENLCMGAPNATEEEMIAAAKAARAHGFIMRLPQGYDTEIGGEGTLSQGQRQLLCIARVMLSRPPMLILDEATSSIDTRTERIVQAAFAELMRGRTCFIVAHRLSTIETADEILVMRDGSIVERGTHRELLAKGGFYAELYEAQFAG